MRCLQSHLWRHRALSTEDSGRRRIVSLVVRVRSSELFMVKVGRERVMMMLMMMVMIVGRGKLLVVLVLLLLLMMKLHHCIFTVSRHE